MTETKDQVEAAPAAEEVKAETAVAEPAKEEAVKVEPNPLERKVEVSVSRADIEKEVQKRLKQYAKKAKFHGFRPGKAPMSMVAATYGFEAEQEAINQLAVDAASKALQEGKFEIVGQPSIYPAEKQDEEGLVKFEVAFEVFPEVKVPDLNGVKVTEYECALTEEDVNKTLDVMRKQRTTYSKVERPAQDNDLVTVDFEGKLNGEVFKGGKADNYKFVLGAGQMLPAFEDAIKGMAIGEEKTFPLTFPAEYPSQELAGKEVSFTVKLTGVEEPHLPELNDEFAASLGITEGGVAQLTADVKENLERELKNRLTNKTKQSVMDALLKATEFPVPHALVEEERLKMVEAQKEMLKARGLTLPDTVFANKELMLDAATNRVRLGLLIQEIIKAEDIKATPEEVKALATDISKSFEDPEEVINWYLNDPQRKSELIGVVLENNVVNWALKNADTQKETVKFEDLMAAQA